MPDTAPLRAALADALPERPFTVSLWDGTAVPTTGTDGPTFTARSPKALAHLLRAPGELGLGHGDERVRVWWLYPRPARNGFETGFTSIFQVRAS